MVALHLHEIVGGIFYLQVDRLQNIQQSHLSSENFYLKTNLKERGILIDFQEPNWKMIGI